MAIYISNHDCFIFRKINPETKLNDSQHMLFFFIFLFSLLFLLSYLLLRLPLRVFNLIDFYYFYCPQILKINHSNNWEKFDVSAPVWYSYFAIPGDGDSYWGGSFYFGFLGMRKG